ncbi:MAG: peptidyl-prolyl cis-trans isomerase, partial [Candidatus Sumerlaeia bacterium]|nr:peptidyl-prolyl cis-trans isomerase [Candidatus Sumerlaeia bacterium]
SRGVYPKEFEAVAFSLDPGQISMIQDSADGFYILRCLEKIPPRDLTLEQARPQILTKLQQSQLKLRHNYELKKLLEEYAPVIDTINFEFRAEDYPVVKVQKFQLTKAEILTLFPQIYKGMLLDVNYLKKVSHRVAIYETIAQFCERQKLTTGNKLLELGGFFSSCLMDGEAVEQEQIKANLQFTEQDERKYYEQHKSEFGGADFYYLYQFVGEVKNPEKYSADELANQMKLLRRKIEDFLAKQKVELANKKLSLLEAALKGEQQKLAEQTALLQVKDIITAVKALEDEQFSFSVKDAGFVNINDFPQIKDLVRGLTADEFSNIYQDEQCFIWFYVAEVKSGLPFEKLKPIVFLRLLDERRQNAMKELKEKILPQSLRDSPLGEGAKNIKKINKGMIQ